MTQKVTGVIYDLGLGMKEGGGEERRRWGEEIRRERGERRTWEEERRREERERRRAGSEK